MKTKTTFYLSCHALIVKEGKYLLTKRALVNLYHPGKYDLPGGTLHPGETLEQALLREVKEETQLEIQIEKLFSIYNNLDSYPQWQVFQVIYLCRHVSGEVKLNPKEHSEFHWVEKEEIKNFESMSFIRDLIAQDDFKKL